MTIQEDRVVDLRQESAGGDSRYLSLRLGANGDLRIEGQDLGPSVGECWGSSRFSEYEWAITIKAADVPAYVRCLGGTPADDVLELVHACFDRNPECVGVGFLEKHGIPNEFWSRVGD
jgi:hypothetical protein